MAPNLTAAIPLPAAQFPAAQLPAAPLPAASCAAPRRERDTFLAAIDGALRELRDRGRRAIRIVDLDGRSGERLIRVARRARLLGFLAIEARGCARSRHAVQVARRAAAAQADPAIGWQFDQIDAAPALAEEEDGADLVLVSARTLAQIDGHGAHTLARAAIDVADDTLVVTTARRDRAHATQVLAAARQLPCTRGVSHDALHTVLVVTDRESGAHAH